MYKSDSRASIKKMYQKTCDPSDSPPWSCQELKFQRLELNVIVVNGAISICAESEQWQQAW